ncbi:hypothetical protein K493DRAFT_74561 [Basidiobolus meristosporus CBS 931.73]|uniref:Nucleoporin Nup54 alpha-helical domain-containing protein n=1 Tax=Basidiobolus meristosporus CBS 931.73 TaxID=1314790 RepID=A0A1Y1XTF0_9FUNG|nr:hypothetical protein K493DRAFT_74561 [Basidiobolus meristosporus CBS 931.73]|eukprot:ORX88786.1 hypothetical protein K493DRAFT_74561 [Basidiobolus meristosporus CBS 931.73]
MYNSWYSLALQRPVPTTWETVALMKESWDPQSPMCLFKHYFYNLVHPSEVHLYQRPANQDETLWNEAQKANPNPKCMVPVLAVGFDDIKKRTEQQEMQALAHKAKLEEIADKIKKLQEKHSLDTLVKMKEYKRRHMDLAHRVLQLMKQVQVLRNKGYSIRPEEEALKTRLENLHLELRKPSQYRSRLHELWSQVQMLKNTRRSNSKGNWEFEVSDEEQLANIEKVLAEQQAGLAHVMEVLQKDLKAVTIMSRSLAEGNNSNSA